MEQKHLVSGYVGVNDYSEYTTFSKTAVQHKCRLLKSSVSFVPLSQPLQYSILIRKCFAIYFLFQTKKFFKICHAWIILKCICHFET